MKEIREKKDKISGITLIALVITIVILIILAGISANLTLGENGILTKTKEAKIMSAIGSITDQIHLDAIQKKIDNIEMSAELLVEEGNAKRRVQQKDDGKYYMYYCIDISKYNGTSGLGKNENSDLKDVFIIDDELNIKYISKDNKEYGNETSEKILEDETKIKFSNEKFRKYIVKKIGTAQGDITFGLMKTQTDLKLEDSQIDSLEDLVFFPNLKTLTLGQYPNEKITLQNLKGIENCKQLSTIRLLNAEIKSLDGIEGCSKLSFFESSNSYVEDFSALKYCDAMETIRFNRASAKYIDTENLIVAIKDIKNLKEVRIIGNNITSMNFLSKINSDITIFDFSNNQIEKIEGLEKFKNLEKITLTNNKIKDITPLAQNVNLKEIVLLNNTSIDGNRSNYTSEQLVLIDRIGQVLDNGGKISMDIDKIGLFTNYKTLNLYNQKLENLNAIEGLTQITELILMNNNLSLKDQKSRDILSNMNVCTYLDLSNNPSIEDVSFINEMGSLKNFKISGDSKVKLKQIEKKISNLRIDVSNDTLLSIVDCNPEYITKINLYGYSGLNCSVPEMAKFSNLTELYIANEPEISSFAGVSDITSLQILDLSNDELHDKMIDFSKLQRIKKLNLSGNNISSEDLKYLNGLKNIKQLELNLSSNAIIDATSLLDFDVSTKINLKGNVNLTKKSKEQLIERFGNNVTL